MRSKFGIQELAAEGLLIHDERNSTVSKSDVLARHATRLQDRKHRFLGYQTNQDVTFPQELNPFLSLNLLNLGDGFEEGTYHLNAKNFERAIIHYYAKLWQLIGTQSDDEMAYWGYVTPMGASEGNLCALWYARDHLSASPGLPATDSTSPVAPKIPVVFFSETAHYSVQKSCNLLQLKVFSEIGPLLGSCPVNGGIWPTHVPANHDGSIDIYSLNLLVTFFIDHGHPVIINFNYGTTFTGAMDDVGGALGLLAPALERADEQGLRHWVHVDGALAANYMPYVEKAMNEGSIEQQAIPGFDFRNPHVRSICASPYKWIGTPWAFGVFVMRNTLEPQAETRPNYVGNRDATISGSRNGLSSVFLWETLTRLGNTGLTDMVRDNEAMANYAHDQINALTERDGFTAQDLLLQPRVPFSNMILFRMPNAEIMNKYTLSSDECIVDGVVHRLCHLVILGHTRKDAIDELVADLAMADAFKEFTTPLVDKRS